MTFPVLLSGMADFQRFDRMNARLFSRYAGAVTLSRVTGSVPIDPARPWLGTTTTTTTEDLQFIATEKAAEYVTAGTIQAGDIVGLLAVPTNAALNPPVLGARITVAGVSVALLQIEAVHSDPGQVLHYAVVGRL